MLYHVNLASEFVDFLADNDPILQHTMARLVIEGLQRLSSKFRKLATNKTRKASHRTKHAVIRRTPQEKAQIAASRRAHRASYLEALNDARNSIMEQAAHLKETFGGHSIEYYLEAILQRSRLAKSTKAPNRWNAYLRQEVKRINDGESFL